jgi:hypothetical protein
MYVYFFCVIGFYCGEMHTINFSILNIFEVYSLVAVSTYTLLDNVSHVVIPTIHL